MSEREGIAGDGGASGGSSDSGDNGNGTGAGDGGGDPGPVCHPEQPACGYRFKRELTFNATALGEVLIDFPVLVTLTDERIDYTKTQAGGADLRFVDEDGTLLSHEIEQWRPGGTSSVWVRIPRFDPRTRKTIRYFYGSSATKVPSRGADVFKADYEAVYHLSDSLAQARIVSDALGQHDGVASAAVSANASVTGRVGDGLTLLGGGQFVEFAGLSGANIPAFTVELWVRETEPRDHARLVCRDSAAAPERPVACLGLDNGRVEAGLTTDDQLTWTTTNTDAEDAWTHLAMVWDARERRLRVLRNGQVAAEEPSGAVLATSLLPWVLGDRSAAGTGFSGAVDEVRIAYVARSATWLLATTVTVNDLLKSYGPEEAL